MRRHVLVAALLLSSRTLCRIDHKRFVMRNSFRLFFYTACVAAHDGRALFMPISARNGNASILFDVNHNACTPTGVIHCLFYLARKNSRARAPRVSVRGDEGFSDSLREILAEALRTSFGIFALLPRVSDRQENGD